MGLSKIILGTVQLGLAYGINNKYGKPDEEKAFELLKNAQNSEIDTLDTASAYGNSEELIGKYHRSNTKFLINTKFHLNESVDLYDETLKTLDVLQVDFIDTYMYHRFADISIETEKYVNALDILKSKGLIKKTGVSIYTNDEFRTAIDSDFIDVIQLPFNVLDNYLQRGELIELAKQKGKDIHTRSAFLQGLFFLEETNWPEKLLSLKPYVKLIREIASTENIPLNVLALKYSLSFSNIDKVLIGVDSANQLKDNIDAVNTPVDESVFNQISEIKVSETELLNPVNWK